MAIPILWVKNGSQSLRERSMSISCHSLVYHRYYFHQGLLASPLSRNHRPQGFDIQSCGPSVSDLPGEGFRIVSGIHSNRAIGSGIVQIAVGYQISPIPKLIVGSEDSLEDERFDHQLGWKARGCLTSSGCGKSGWVVNE